MRLLSLLVLPILMSMAVTASAASSCEGLFVASTDRLEWATKRLVLKAIGPEYAEQAFAMMDPPEVRRRLGPSVPESVEKTRSEILASNVQKTEFIKRSRLARAKAPLGIFKDGELIGIMSFKADYWGPNVWTRLHRTLFRHVVTIGYVIRPEFQRQGFASEAMARLVQVAFDELGTDDVYASVFPGNIASRQTLEKAGLRPMKVSTEEMIYYRISRAAWYGQRIKKFFLSKD